jgi:hypothetical protein
MKAKSYEFGPDDVVRLRGVGVATDGHVSGEVPPRPGSTVDRLVERNGKLMEQRAADAATIAALRVDLAHARELLLTLSMMCVALLAFLIWRCI